MQRLGATGDLVRRFLPGLLSQLRMTVLRLFASISTACPASLVRWGGRLQLCGTKPPLRIAKKGGRNTAAPTFSVP